MPIRTPHSPTAFLVLTIPHAISPSTSLSSPPPPAPIVTTVEVPVVATLEARPRAERRQSGPTSRQSTRPARMRSSRGGGGSAGPWQSNCAAERTRARPGVQWPVPAGRMRARPSVARVSEEACSPGGLGALCRRGGLVARVDSIWI